MPSDSADGAPTRSVTDAAALSRVVDGTVMVVGADRAGVPGRGR